jgi:hypothetical protein
VATGAAPGPRCPTTGSKVLAGGFRGGTVDVDTATVFNLRAQVAF